MTAEGNSNRKAGWSLLGDIAIILAINIQMSLAACVVAKAFTGPAVAEPARIHTK